MPSPTAGTATPAAAGDQPASIRTFILIVATEAVTIAALYWFGLHFS